MKFPRYFFSYNASVINDSTTESYLKIYSIEKELIPISQLHFTVDKNKPAYKLIKHLEVIDEAKKVSLTLKNSDMNALIKSYEVFMRSILNDINIDNKSELVQALFFHNAILNTVDRSKLNKLDCGCTPHNLYFVGKSPFWCQEDYLIQPNEIIKHIEDTKYLLNEIDIRVYKFLLENRNAESISIDKITAIIEPDYNKKVLKYYQKYVSPSKSQARVASCSDCPVWGICGSQLGCCGNYSGCCWVASMSCLMHDIACMKCDHWHCGPACKPGSGNQQ